MEQKLTAEGKRVALLANEANPRLPWGTDRAEVFRRSLAEYGDLSGIVENVRTGRLVGGHKRTDQFERDENASVVITDTLPKPDSTGTLAFGYVISFGTRWAYRRVDWPEPKEAAANLAANQFGAEFDWEGVTAMLQKAEGFDLSLTGFEPHVVENLGRHDWTPHKPTEPAAGGGRIDPIHLTADARKLLDEVKVKLAVPFHATFSCYEGRAGGVHCGKCGTCVERREAFTVAGVADPTVYCG